MKLKEAMTMYAGGPGSGRHPEGGSLKKGDVVYHRNERMFPGRHVITKVNDNGTYRIKSLDKGPSINPPESFSHTADQLYKVDE